MSQVAVILTAVFPGIEGRDRAGLEIIGSDKVVRIEVPLEPVLAGQESVHERAERSLRRLLSDLDAWEKLQLPVQAKS